MALKPLEIRKNNVFYTKVVVLKLCLESKYGADFKSPLSNIKLSPSVLFKTNILFKKVLSATR
jgi:hypothetical protein